MNLTSQKFLERPGVAPAFVVLLALAATLGVLANGWTLDADVDITANRLVTGQGTLVELMTSDYVAKSGMHSGFWRPVVSLLYWIFWRLGGGEPFLFFTANILLHAGISAGVWLLARRLGASPFCGLTAAALFAVHPVHTDVTAGVVGLKDLLATAGFVFGLLLQFRGRAEGSRGMVLGGAGLFLLGILSKESALALIPVLFLLDLGDRNRDKGGWRILALSYAGLLGAAGLKFGIQRILLGSTLEGIEIHQADNPLILLSPLAARFHALEIVPLYSRLLFWPHPLSPDYGYNSLPLGSIHAPTGVLLGGAILIFLAVAGFWAWKRGHSVLFAALALLFAGYLPVSNLVVLLGTQAAERFLYLPSIGFCLGISWLLSHARFPRRWAWGILILAVAAGGIKSEVRNRDWRDLYTLWTSAARVIPGNLKAALAAGQQYIARGEYEKAAALYQKTLQQEDPDPRTRPIGEIWRPPLMAMEGAALTEMGRLPEAFSILTQAVTLAPANVLTRFHYGRVLHRLNDPSAAMEQLEAALQNRPNLEQRKWVEDEKQAVQAILASSPGSTALPAEATVNLILCDRRFQAGDIGGAIQAVKAALQIAPENVKARMNLGILLRQAGRAGEAETEFRNLTQRVPDNPVLWFLLGKVLEDQNRPGEAREAYRQALSGVKAGDSLVLEIQQALASLSLPPR